MVCGELVTPTAVTVMVVEYVPGASPGRIGVAVNDPGVVPEVVARESHGAVVLTLQPNVSVPELEMVTVWEAGSLPPCMAEKARPVGLRLIVEVAVSDPSGSTNFRPSARPFPESSLAMAKSVSEVPSTLHPVSCGRQRTISPSVIDRKRND
jgi:hypothetical protein